MDSGRSWEGLKLSKLRVFSFPHICTHWFGISSWKADRRSNKRRLADNRPGKVRREAKLDSRGRGAVMESVSAPPFMKTLSMGWK